LHNSKEIYNQLRKRKRKNSRFLPYQNNKANLREKRVVFRDYTSTIWCGKYPYEIEMDSIKLFEE
jgi:hypothetical protein